MPSHDSITYVPLTHKEDDRSTVLEQSSLSTEISLNDQENRPGFKGDGFSGEEQSDHDDDEPHRPRAISPMLYPISPYPHAAFTSVEVPARHWLPNVTLNNRNTSLGRKPNFKSKNTKMSHGLSFHIWWPWRWEISTMLLSVICLGILVAVLLIFEGRAQDEWTEAYRISPNAIVSILTTTAKGSMMLAIASCISQLKWLHFQQPRKLQDLEEFDNASRGPWGSLTFLLNVKGRAVLAVLGAITTITALGYEPLAQQLISYPNRLAAITNGTATITRATSWGSSSLLGGPGVGSPNLSVLQNALVLQNAITNGFVGNTGNVTFYCSTSVCKFPDFTSLAFCSGCQDVSNIVQKDCTDGGGGLECTFTPDDPFSNTVSLVLPRGEDAHGNEKDQIGFAANSTYQNFAAWAIYYNLTTLNISIPQWWNPGTDDQNATKPQISSCYIAPCLKTFADVAIINGHLKSADVTSTPLYLGKYSHDFNIQSDPFGLSTNLNGTMEFFLDDTTISFTLDLLRKETQGWLVYSTDGTTDGQDSGNLSTGFLYLLRNNITATVDALAQALTNMVMNVDNQNATQLQGRPMGYIPVIHVRWLWLSLPLCLTLASSGLLVLSIILSSRIGTEPLKSSQLALLLCQLEGWQFSKTLSGGDYHSLEDEVKEMKVILTSKKTGRSFLKVE